jgi:superfamily II DNA or RNA helicase
MDTILKINNGYSHLITPNQYLKDKIFEKLRFRTKDYFHNRAYRQGVWDGFVNFFDKKTGRFLTGLMPEMRLLLNHYNTDFQSCDERNMVDFAHQTIDETFLPGITLHDYQADLINQALKHKRGIIQAPPGAGKAQPLDSLIYTPDGPKLMGEINVGDEICTPDGEVSKVIGIYPQGPKEIYEITFSNGDKVQASKDHLWKLDGDKWQDKIKDTNYIINKLKNKRSRLRIKFPKFVYFNKQKVRIHPYLMGVLIGDGCLDNSVGLSNVLEKIKKIIKKGYTLEHSKGCDYKIQKENRGSRYNFYFDMLKYYNLAGKLSYDKFIPKDYKYNSKIVRIKLLQGLLDTDGYVTKNGAIEYSTSSEILAHDIKELAESLGGYCHIRNKIPSYDGEKKDGRISYIVTIFFKENFDRLSDDKRNINSRIIESVKFVGIKHCQCILISDPKHMYLTNHMIPTHNTFVMISIMKALPPKTPILFLANRKSLITQNYKEIKKWGFDNVGRFYSDYHEPNIITCATVQSAHLLDKLLPKFKVVIADEIHMLSNNTGIRTFRKLKDASVRIAVSATPFKFGGTDNVQKYTIKGYFGPIFKTKVTESGVLKMSDLQDKETLSNAECVFYYIDEPKIPYEIFIDAITNGIAQNMHFHKLVQRLISKLTGRNLILVERIAHGDHLKSLIPNALWVSGKDDEQTREYVINELQRSKEKVVAIATRQIFDTGLNFFIHNLIDCGITSNEHGTTQTFGRGLRPAEDKGRLTYYSFIHRTNPYLQDHSMRKVKNLKKEKQTVIIKDTIDF